ncbi:MAG: glycosyltransferase [Alphaproteobacteria bacterium]
MSEKRPPIAVVLKGYPRLSETFIAQELQALEAAGQPLALYSLRRPTEVARHPVHKKIRAPVHYLPEYLYREPGRVWRAWVQARRLPGYAKTRALFWRHWLRDPTPNRGRRFGQALVLATELPEAIRHLYVHFLHTPASVTDYAAMMAGRSWSFSAHAKDIWLTPDWEKREKLARSLWGTTCTRFGYEHLRALMEPNRTSDLDLAYHGLDLENFPAAKRQFNDNDGTDPAAPVMIISVGRAVEKKGYSTLLDALAQLPAHVHWRFHHIGGGTLARKLAARAEKLGLADRITWAGSQPQSAVIALLARADIFALASCIAKDGDRDGLPNVLMEAQAQSVACLATRVSGIEEFIIDGQTGLLVAPGDTGALAAGLARMIGAPQTRRALAQAGLKRLRVDFSFHRCFEPLRARFGLGSNPQSARERRAG